MLPKMPYAVVLLPAHSLKLSMPGIIRHSNWCSIEKFEMSHGSANCGGGATTQLSLEKPTRAEGLMPRVALGHAMGNARGHGVAP